jgi:RecB family endonuclease NucS
MANVDAFGLRLGSKVSKAASLAARRKGATMREIVEATGGDKRQTKYNIFVILKAKGHKVRREEGRIFLEHKDGVCTEDDVGGAEESPSEWPPARERYLQGKLRESLHKLEPGLVAIDGGREQGRRDITAKDQAGNTVVIELKPGKAGADAVTQLLIYMGEVKAAQNPSGLRGILVAEDFQAKAVTAASVVPNIALKRYTLSDLQKSDLRNSVGAE